MVSTAPEDKGPPERFAPVFQRAGRAGLKRTAHVCEDYAPTPATNYAVCRDVLGCDRLDHGYRLLTDETLCARAREDGIAFTCCPKPSTRERDAIRLDAIKHMHAAGLAITLATDDPAMFETDIGEAYRRFFLGAHLGMADARAIALNAVNAAWLDEPHRAQLRQSFEEKTPPTGFWGKKGVWEGMGYRLQEILKKESVRENLGGGQGGGSAGTLGGRGSLPPGEGESPPWAVGIRACPRINA